MKEEVKSRALTLCRLGRWPPHAAPVSLLVLFLVLFLVLGCVLGLALGLVVVLCRVWFFVLHLVLVFGS